jgi:hypothetical protein
MFIGTTLQSKHNFVLSPGEGMHELVITDMNGLSIKRSFEIITQSRNSD